MSYRGVSTRSEFTQIRQGNHPRHREMATSPSKEVKAPPHFKTRRSRVHGHDLRDHGHLALPSTSHSGLFTRTIKYGIRQLSIIALLVKRVEFGRPFLVAHMLDINQTVVDVRLADGRCRRREVGAPRLGVRRGRGRRRAVVAYSTSISLSHLSCGASLTVKTLKTRQLILELGQRLPPTISPAGALVPEHRPALGADAAAVALGAAVRRCEVEHALVPTNSALGAWEA